MLWKLWHLSYNYKSMSLSFSSKWKNYAISPMIPMMTESFSQLLVIISPTTPPSSLIYKTKQFLKSLNAIKSFNSFVMLYIAPLYSMTCKERSQTLNLFGFQRKTSLTRNYPKFMKTFVGYILISLHLLINLLDASNFSVLLYHSLTCINLPFFPTFLLQNTSIKTPYQMIQLILHPSLLNYICIFIVIMNNSP